MIRRRPFALPYADQIPLLVFLLSGQALRQPVDERRLVAAARRHKVLPYIVTATRAGSLVLSSELRDQVASHTGLRAIQASVLRRVLPRLTDVLEAACDAPPVLIKGPAVADRYYPDPVLRPFIDLDLLVPRERLRAAVGAMEREGFEARLEFREGYAERHGHDVHVVGRLGTRRIHVELHWRVGDDPATAILDHRFVAAGAEHLRVGRSTVAVPATQRQLLILAAHLLSERKKSLAWVHDLALVGAAATGDQWRDAFSLADEHGLSWVLHRALDYAAFHLGFHRARPAPSGPRPPFGPLRAVEELDLQAAPHVGRLATLPWRERPVYMWMVLFPTQAGLEGTVGGDGTRGWRLLTRHARRVLAGLAPRPD